MRHRKVASNPDGSQYLRTGNINFNKILAFFGRDYGEMCNFAYSPKQAESTVYTTKSTS